ncbi:hypothetical protein M8312_11810 [Sphingomonas sp. KRR8]|uniref:CBU_0592 family membrane protein n=1 Tax=Sphingomonas sp. KRR8 TaxID=2942996 RepID=UPI0020222281|nr:hypothetical protein [Sphingomonas sp. KRR8]URD60462.1 hypothetical protein M8312_11810 [Sphingomonas sp. KRR8]
MTVHLVVEVVGWIGAALILLAYALLTMGRIPARSLAYQGMNVVGALGFIVNSGYNGAVPSAALNVVWALIGLVAISRLPRRSARAQATQE